ARNGYSAIAITDHDTVSGVIRGIEAAHGTPLELIPGIELSAMDQDDDIHILGYYIRYDDPEFVKSISFFKEKRRDRAEEIVECLNYLGLEITIDIVLNIAHGAPIGRPHIAEALLSENQIVHYNEAFIRYIGANGPAFVPKYRITPRETIELILKNGGIPVLAHPLSIRRDDIIPGLVESGLMGIEAVHPLHHPEKQLYYRKLAEKYGLIATGGSDWHGATRRRNFTNILESSKIPLKTVREMKLLVNSRKISGGKRFTSES
ncbi:MAG: PHP domain-containing protein, partial [Candidatus Latescibacteria bacterium]|nr:PHP domain-containing protein [Candidatus Latescibacterota bacterium]